MDITRIEAATRGELTVSDGRVLTRSVAAVAADG